MQNAVSDKTLFLLYLWSIPSSQLFVYNSKHDDRMFAVQWFLSFPLVLVCVSFLLARARINLTFGFYLHGGWSVSLHCPWWGYTVYTIWKTWFMVGMTLVQGMEKEVTPVGEDGWCEVGLFCSFSSQHLLQCSKCMIIFEPSLSGHNLDGKTHFIFPPLGIY